MGSAKHKALNTSSFQEEPVKVNALAKFMKGLVNDTKMCENLKVEIDQLFLERNKLASENVELKEEIGHLYKMKTFNKMQHMMYLS